MVQILGSARMTTFTQHAQLSEQEHLFKGRHFEQEIIVLCVRWYLSYKLSYRDLSEMMAERGLSVAHTTILRWVQRYTPESDKRWSRCSARVGTSWRMDETYVRIRGQWAYLYRAVDKAGKTVDSRLSPRRNVASAKAFFRKAVRSQGQSPETTTLGGYAASHSAVRELQQQGRLAELTKLRSSKYLNNLIEQDHRNIKGSVALLIKRRNFRYGTLPLKLDGPVLPTQKIGQRATLHRRRRLKTGPSESCVSVRCRRAQSWRTETI